MATGRLPTVYVYVQLLYMYHKINTIQVANKDNYECLAGEMFGKFG